MRVTKQTNYAVRMLMYCAADPGALSRVPDIARAYGVSELFLFKILKPLVKAGLIETVRGRNGGIRLGTPSRRYHSVRRNPRHGRQLCHGGVL